MIITASKDSTMPPKLTFMNLVRIDLEEHILITVVAGVVDRFNDSNTISYSHKFTLELPVLLPSERGGNIRHR